jgi:toxin ParE1/3/4
MSARKRRLILKPDARADMRGILLYTQQHWGGDQRRRYRTRLYDAMRSLRDYPEWGRQRDEYFPGCRGLVVEQHVIFYRLTDEEIVVLRILHGTQDATDQVHP